MQAITIGTQDSVLSVRISAGWALAAGADAVKLAWASGLLSESDLCSACSCIAQGLLMLLPTRGTSLCTDLFEVIGCPADIYDA